MNNISCIYAFLAYLLVGGTSSFPANAKKKKKPRNKKRAGGNALKMGEIHLARSELLGSILVPAKTGSTGGVFNLQPAKFPFLGSIARSFEKYKFLKFHAFYKPAVGSTIGGLVTIGMDFDASTKAEDKPTRAQATCYTPSKTWSVWQDGQSGALVVPPSVLQTRAWYFKNSEVAADKGLGNLVWAVNVDEQTAAKTFGEIWIDYSIIFSGTSPGN